MMQRSFSSANAWQRSRKKPRLHYRQKKTSANFQLRERDAPLPESPFIYK